MIVLSRRIQAAALKFNRGVLPTSFVGLTINRNLQLRSAEKTQLLANLGNGNNYHSQSDTNSHGLGWAAKISAGVALLALGFGANQRILPSSCEPTNAIAEGAATSSSLSISGNKSFLLKDSYRKRLFFNYERRIRAFSPPEKVFEYFASIKDSDGQCYMTPGDLLRAVVPVYPPSESPYIREGNLPGEHSLGDLRSSPSDFFLLFDTNGDGRISFSEYLFFVTLLSVPEVSTLVAFKMFDVDGNGMIDREEFRRVMQIQKSRTRQGAAHHDGRRSIVSKTPASMENCGLLQLFFGEDGKRLLSFEGFESFLHKLYEEIVRLEFAHYDFRQRGTISAYDFGLSMVASADLRSVHHYLDRVDLLSVDTAFQDKRVTYEEFYQFARLRKKFPVLSVALSSFGNGLLSKSDFQRAAQICGVTLSQHIIDIVYHIFDLNGDGSLSMQEFLGVLQRREEDIADPMEPGIIQFFKCWWRCGKNCHFSDKCMSM